MAEQVAIPYTITATGVQYDPSKSVYAIKVANAPSSAKIIEQAKTEAPGAGGFFSELWGVAKNLLMKAPISVTTGKYTLARDQMGNIVQSPTPVYMPPIIAEKSGIETYLPYILIGGAGLLVVVIMLRR